MVSCDRGERIEHWPIDKLVFYARNPRKNHSAVDRMFRAEVFNTLNHPNFRANSLNTNFDSPSAGQFTASQPSRQIQFALKMIF